MELQYLTTVVYVVVTALAVVDQKSLTSNIAGFYSLPYLLFK
jgi:hypothetical protein